MPDFDVVSLLDHDAPSVGDTAPDFTRPLVNAEFWEDASLSDLADDGPVLLVFHTMAGAFPATYVWNELRDRGVPEDVQAVGVSISSPYEHKSFLEARDVDARLFSDPAAGVAADYDLEHDLDGMTGVTEHRPAVFLLDEDRTVQYRWVADEWPDFPDYEGIEDALDDL
ncbi:MULTISPECIES: redoxin domain-containing protein [Haloferax]|uniref:Thiol peroxidase n=1 Tax=Haloferax massiliensis TaxID=1476858 RepID=A0A0D6JUI0_9EURY|nr:MULTISPECIES: redoxin domain-containing protein [Haloferax]MDS0242711.1 redoxin domain-containing protein [Haloferax sp. S2CR25]MDS0445832.1 redoxin domain-containing protein [Haloferax sp. S2CR25-2]CQR51396.1 thiol peroxidase [Haloferax massiliensis]